ncbi:ankyrin repeat domain-containing protein 49-like [Littorina saxatilis]|uniref:Ankyrin repeat domain-containing protein 49 n=1 Tax=Littorina saxatilis TaxID=31220 RepID=A0AAN9AU91_9CAEN
MGDCEEGEDDTNGLDVYNSDILKQIMEAKNGEPNRFQSFWEKDEQDVDEFTEEEIRNEPKKRILWAAENNKMEEVQQLLTADPSLVHSVDKDGYTPLHRAAYGDHLEMAEYLLSNGANLLARTEDGWQPLHSACRWNCARVAELLLHNGAEINSQSNGGLTALHLACSEHDAVEVVELLLWWPSVDVNVVCNGGQTPAQLAAQSAVLDHLFHMASPSINQLHPTDTTV